MQVLKGPLKIYRPPVVAKVRKGKISKHSKQKGSK